MRGVRGDRAAVPGGDLAYQRETETVTAAPVRGAVVRVGREPVEDRRQDGRVDAGAVVLEAPPGLPVRHADHDPHGGAGVADPVVQQRGDGPAQAGLVTVEEDRGVTALHGEPPPALLGRAW